MLKDSLGELGEKVGEEIKHGGEWTDWLRLRLNVSETEGTAAEAVVEPMAEFVQSIQTKFVEIMGAPEMEA